MKCGGRAAVLQAPVARSTPDNTQSPHDAVAANSPAAPIAARQGQ